MSEEKKVVIEESTGLNVEDLKLMSVSQLKKYIDTLEGEDKKIATEVLERKLKRNEGIRELPGVAAEIEISQDAAGIDKDARNAVRIEKEAEKEKIKAEALAEKAVKDAEREKVKELAELEKKVNAAKALEAKVLKAEEKEKARLEKLKEKEEAKIREMERAEKALEAAKLEREKVIEEKKAAREAAAAKKREEENLRVAAVAARLREVNVKTEAGSKTDDVRRLMAEGKTNREIANETGYGIKFVCDNVWRIARQIEVLEFRKQMAEKHDAALAAATTEGQADQI